MSEQRQEQISRDGGLRAGGFDETGGTSGPRPQYDLIRRWLEETPRETLDLKRREAELLFRRIGITFAVYTGGGDPERLIPFDIIPRILDAAEWDFLARGLQQRVKALNAFIRDVYHGRDILRAGLVPEALILQNEAFRAEMQGFEPAQARLYARRRHRPRAHRPARFLRARG